MFTNISNFLNDSLSGFIMKGLDNTLQTSTNYEKEPTIKSVQEDMIFEADESKMEELQIQLDELSEGYIEPTKDNIEKFPEMFI